MISIEKTILFDEDSPLKKGKFNGREMLCDNSLEYYVFMCGQSLSRVSNSIDKTKLSLAYLKSSYSSPPTLEGSCPSDFIEYSIENFFIRSHGIYDRVLIFVNRLCDIGLADESISHNAIITNDHVKSYSLDAPLKKLRKVCTEYRLERNTIIHHASYSEDTFDTFTMMHKVHSLAPDSDAEAVIDSAILHGVTNDYIDDYIEEFNAHLELIDNTLKNFYDVAEKVYLNKKSWFTIKI
jgi:hypothetical protein